MKKTSRVKWALFALFIFVLGLAFFPLAKEKIIDGKFFKYSLKFLKEKKPGVAPIVKYFPFSRENSLKEWEEKILKGKVAYGVEKGGELSYVRAESKKTASALYYKIALDTKRNPVLSWRWRVDKFPKRSEPERIEDKKEEDFAARVYVIFPAAFFTGSRVIEYIWAETLPVGTHGVSGYSKNIKVLVVESGRSQEWRYEERDICSDYVKLFGVPPHLDIGAIAFMTDADSTKTSAEAVYDEIKIGYK
ncbi:MAG: DUF3047 domain-containing protein [Omnitrophica bacterium]|nr:DUF3047 domain-containing protein [Candidatus Omnitrophota bacterium]